MPTRRSTFANPHPDIYDPNDPTSEAEHLPDLAQSPLEPLLQFPRPPIPNLSSLATRLVASLSNTDFESLACAAAASLPGSPIVSPQQSPFFASQPTSLEVGYVGAGGAVTRAPSGDRGGGARAVDVALAEPDRDLGRGEADAGGGVSLGGLADPSAGAEQDEQRGQHGGRKG
jgi:hypothetical protein